jgi:hypothetical protein
VFNKRVPDPEAVLALPPARSKRALVPIAVLSLESLTTTSCGCAAYAELADAANMVIKKREAV